LAEQLLRAGQHVGPTPPPAAGVPEAEGKESVDSSPGSEWPNRTCVVATPARPETAMGRIWRNRDGAPGRGAPIAGGAARGLKSFARRGFQRQGLGFPCRPAPRPPTGGSSRSRATITTIAGLERGRGKGLRLRDPRPGMRSPGIVGETIRQGPASGPQAHDAVGVNAHHHAVEAAAKVARHDRDGSRPARRQLAPAKMATRQRHPPAPP